ncbi:phenylalanyl-tRNA synthetase [Rhizoctonia solani]|uniref:phenylalanine--tRNA ligase n=1 Tax=Rhizoctonia solani TaxID=456999 RepID=A0A8H8NPQ6_9AGAM|nr:phenylalanyl-tRNA synthetase [Rhizoctonia solani]QRW16133.1 phenylalanyl-tRNA synthetase [Rhizoctonia solani]
MESLQQLIIDTLERDGKIADTRAVKLPPALHKDDVQEAQMVIQGTLNSLLIVSSSMERFAKKGSGPALSIPELKKIVGDESAKIGQGRAFKSGWIGKEGDGLVKLEIQSTGTLAAGDKSINELKKRKLVVQRSLVHGDQGKQLCTSIAKPETDLTYDMLQTGVWKNSTFKQYNFEAEGTPTGGGALHPLLKVREEFRNIFFEMGPSRVSSPSERLRDVARTQAWGFGSIGYRAPWREADSRRLLLRTHTTATSARMLKAVADREGGFKPIKMFSIDRVFRNEAVDATHLAEFHQVEGLVADRGITLGDLIGFMQTFFKKMGVDNLRFKPAYNPYTEPSLEIFAFHKGQSLGRDRQQWDVPPGNAGANGSASRCARLRLGSELRAAYNDSLTAMAFPTSERWWDTRCLSKVSKDLLQFGFN